MQNDSQQRQFDWGPPVQTGDGTKEWLTYLVIIAVLSVGTWFLLDINHKKQAGLNEKKQVVTDQKLETVIPHGYNDATVAWPSSAVQDIPAETVSSGRFFVQIGAFGDEPSANQISEMLKKEGIEATLLKPDEQFEIFRLVVGPFNNEKEAEDKAEQLNAIDFPCFVVEAQ